MTAVTPVKTQAALGGFAKQLTTQDDESCCHNFKILFEEKEKPKINQEDLMNYKYKANTEHEIEGEDEEELSGHNLLHLAVCFKKTKTAILLIDNFPGLITQDVGEWPANKHTYLGLTPFHIAVAQGDDQLIRHMMKKDKQEPEKQQQQQQQQQLYLSNVIHGAYNSSKERSQITHGSKVTISDINMKQNTYGGNGALPFGKRTRGTVFMGQLPLSVAVLSYIMHTEHTEDDSSSEDSHKKIIAILTEISKTLTDQNYKGDTVFHSIMRFVNCFPSKQGNAKVVMKYLDERIKETLKDDYHTRDQEFERSSIYFHRNKDGETALQLAMKYAHIDLFKELIDLEGVYHLAKPHDDVYEIGRYDVTEIDRIVWQQAGEERSDTKKSMSESVTELLCSRRSLDDAITLINTSVFEAIIKRKWQKYRWYYMIFFLFHFFNVVCLNVHIIAKGSEIVDRSLVPTALVTLGNIYFLLVGLFYILQEAFRYIRAGEKFAWRAVHHNVIYRLCLLISGICLVIDSCVNLVPGVRNNWFLLFAILTSTWFLLFFIRGCPYFSVYVVFINEALFKAVLPFAVLIFLQVFVFSSCMHSFFLDLEPDALADPDLVAFESYGKSALAMGKLMVGMTEIENLLSSNQDVLAVISFVVFVLIAFLLMVNALIGVMTNRFGDTHSSRVQVTLLQKLSILIFFEGWFVGCLAKLAMETGTKIQTETEMKNNRYIISFRKVPSGEADEPSNLEHKLKRNHNILTQMQDKINRILDNQLRQSPHTGPANLHVYHYSKA